MLLFNKWSRFIGILFTLERQPIIAFQTENAFPTKQMLKPCKWNTMKHSEKQWNARYNYANETHDETMKMKHSEKKQQQWNTQYNHANEIHITQWTHANETQTYQKKCLMEPQFQHQL